MESIYGQNHPSIADIMNNLGMLLKKEGKYIEALDYLKRALRISKHYYGQDHPTIGIYLTNVGDIQRKVGFIFPERSTLSFSFSSREISKMPKQLTKKHWLH